MHLIYSHLNGEVVDTLKTVSNTIPKYVPGGMTSIMAGPDTHWNKSFKGKIHGKMDEWLDTEEYEMTKSGKIKPAPYKKICDWVVEAWNEIPDEVIRNNFFVGLRILHVTHLINRPSVDTKRKI